MERGEKTTFNGVLLFVPTYPVFDLQVSKDFLGWGPQVSLEVSRLEKSKRTFPDKKHGSLALGPVLTERALNSLQNGVFSASFCRVPF